MKKPPILQEYCLYCNYLAPKGRERLCFLGEQLAQRHLTFHDRLIGIVGGAGSGKSSLIKGMFPGLSLANDDDGLDQHKIMQVNALPEDLGSATTFHLDMRFQTAFSQPYQIADFVRAALARGRRVIVEHFELLYPALKINADMLIGIGDEILIVRPNIFGPLPGSVYDIVYASLQRRKAAHTLEHLAIHLLVSGFGINDNAFHSSDLAGGFVLRFAQKPEIDLDLLETRLKETIAQNLPSAYVDEEHLKVGSLTLHCNGPRIHVHNTGEIGPFKIIKQLVYDEKTATFCLLGLLGGQDKSDLYNLNKINMR
ncbi:MAG: alanine-tRNA synthetase second additional domain-containing protein [Elusimicrobiota bacterium]|jgi:hypothetical protein|nr:alanine-tRNA synthetase second additional domain-containing protein [Elusimicrobiota bacterium]